LLICGDTFIIPKSSASREHLWIVITDPDPSTREAVCVNLTSAENQEDRTVIANVGDHPFIKHETIVFYKDAQILDMAKVEVALQSKQTAFVCTAHRRCTAVFLKRVQNGLLKSEHANREVKDYCRNKWGQ
jgi:hypothetical protein